MSLLTKRLLKRALAEKQQEFRKRAFIPMGAAAEKTGAQAPGPGGMPVDPMAAGGMPPMDPMAAGGAPMDPMAAGAPPMDPAAMGAPMDPMAAGGAPMDPLAAMPPEGDLPPLPEEGGEGGEGVTAEDAETVDKITQRTMDVVKQTLEMVGKTKEPKKEEVTEAAVEEQPVAEEPPPEAMPGPVTGEPGFNPAEFGGGNMKMSSAILGHVLLKHAAAAGAGIKAKDQLKQLKAKPKPVMPPPSTAHTMSQEYRDRQAQRESVGRQLKGRRSYEAELARRAQEFAKKRRAPDPQPVVPPAALSPESFDPSRSTGATDPGWKAKREAEARQRNPTWPYPPGT